MALGGKLSSKYGFLICILRYLYTDFSAFLSCLSCLCGVMGAWCDFAATVLCYWNVLAAAIEDSFMLQELGHASASTGSFAHTLYMMHSSRCVMFGNPVQWCCCSWTLLHLFACLCANSLIFERLLFAHHLPLFESFRELTGAILLRNIKYEYLALRSPSPSPNPKSLFCPSSSPIVYCLASFETRL